jgi:hypothetical protein
MNDKLRAIVQLAYFRPGLTQTLGQLLSLSGTAFESGVHD